MVIFEFGYRRSMIQAQHDAKVQSFISAGPRFTAQDGQELCLIVRDIAIHSYGFPHAGKQLPDCNYMRDAK